MKLRLPSALLLAVLAVVNAPVFATTLFPSPPAWEPIGTLETVAVMATNTYLADVENSSNINLAYAASNITIYGGSAKASTEARDMWISVNPLTLDVAGNNTLQGNNAAMVGNINLRADGFRPATSGSIALTGVAASTSILDKTVTGDVNIQADNSSLGAVKGVLGSGRMTGDLTIYLINSTGTIVTGADNGKVTDISLVAGSVNIALQNSQFSGAIVGAGTFSSVGQGVSIILDNTQLCKETISGSVTTHTGQGITGTFGTVSAGGVSISLANGSHASAITGGSGVASNITGDISISIADSIVASYAVDSATNTTQYTVASIVGSNGTVTGNTDITISDSKVGAITLYAGGIDATSLPLQTGNLTLILTNTDVLQNGAIYDSEGNIVTFKGQNITGLSEGSDVVGDLTMSLTNVRANAITGLTAGKTLATTPGGLTELSGKVLITLKDSQLTSTITGAGANSIVGNGISIILDNTQALSVTSASLTPTEVALNITRVALSSGQSITGTSGVVSGGGVQITVQNTQTDPSKRIQSWIGNITGAAGTANVTGDIAISVSDTKMGNERLAYNAEGELVQETFSGGDIRGLYEGTAVLPSFVDGSLTIDLMSVISYGTITGSGKFSTVSNGISISLDNTQAVSFTNSLATTKEQESGIARVKTWSGQTITGTAGTVSGGDVQITVQNTQADPAKKVQSWVGSIIGGTATANITGDIDISVSNTKMGTERYDYDDQGVLLKTAWSSGSITGLAQGTSATELSQLNGVLRISLDSVELYGAILGAGNFSTVSGGIIIGVDNTRAVSFSDAPGSVTEQGNGIARVKTLSGQSITGTAGIVTSGGVTITVDQTNPDAQLKSWIGGIIGATATADIQGGNLRIDVSDTFVGTERYGYDAEGHEVVKTLSYGNITGLSGAAQLTGDLLLDIKDSTMGSLIVVDNASLVTGNVLVNISNTMLTGSVSIGGSLGTGVILGDSTVNLSGTNSFASTFRGDYVNTLDPSQTKGFTNIVVQSGTSSFTGMNNSVVGVGELKIQDGATVSFDRQQSRDEEIQSIVLESGSTLQIVLGTEALTKNARFRGTNLSGEGLLNVSSRFYDATKPTTISTATIEGDSTNFRGDIVISGGSKLILSQGIAGDGSINFKSASFGGENDMLIVNGLTVGMFDMNKLSGNGIFGTDSLISLSNWTSDNTVKLGVGLFLNNASVEQMQNIVKDITIIQDDKGKDVTLTSFYLGGENVQLIGGQFNTSANHKVYGLAKDTTTFGDLVLNMGGTTSLYYSSYFDPEIAGLYGVLSGQTVDSVTLNITEKAKGGTMMTSEGSIVKGKVTYNVDSDWTNSGVIRDENGRIVINGEDEASTIAPVLSLVTGGIINSTNANAAGDGVLRAGETAVELNFTKGRLLWGVMGVGKNSSVYGDVVMNIKAASMQEQYRSYGVAEALIGMGFGQNKSSHVYGNIYMNIGDAQLTSQNTVLIDGSIFGSGGGTLHGSTHLVFDGSDTTIENRHWRPLVSSNPDGMWIPNTSVYIAGGAAYAGDIEGNTNITINNATIHVSVYGGSIGTRDWYLDKDNQHPEGWIEADSMSTISGDTNITINGGLMKLNIYGGGRGDMIDGSFAEVLGNSNITITGGIVEGNVYGAGSYSAVLGSSNIKLTGGAVKGDVYAGGVGSQGTAGSSVITVTGGTVSGVFDGKNVLGDSRLVWDSLVQEGKVQNFSHIDLKSGALTSDNTKNLKNLQLAKDTYYTVNGGEANTLQSIQGVGNFKLIEDGTKATVGNIGGKANISLAAGTSLSITGTSDINALSNAGSLSWTGSLIATTTNLTGGTLNFKVGDTLNTGTLNLTSGSINMYIPVASETVTLISYGSFTGDLSNLVLNKVESTRYSYTLVNDTTNKQIQLVVEGKAMDLTWVGGADGSGTWGLTDSSKAWTSPELGGTDFFNMDSVLFDKAANITVDGLVQANRLKVATSGAVILDGSNGTVSALSTENLGSLTISSGAGHQLGSMSNQGSFVADGSSVGAASWQGAGSVALQNGAALSVSGNATMSSVVNEGTLNLAGASVLGALTGAGTTSFNGTSLTIASMTGGSLELLSGNVAITGSSQIASVHNDANLTLAGTSSVGAVTGMGNLIFQGTSLSLDSLLASGLTLSAGTVDVKGSMTVHSTTLASSTVLNLAGQSNLGAVVGGGVINIAAESTIASLAGKTQLNIVQNAIATILGNAELGLVSNFGTLSLAGASLDGLAGTGVLNNSGILTLKGTSFDASSITGGTINLQSGTATAQFVNTSVAVSKGASLNLKDQSNLSVSGEGAVIVGDASNATLQSVAGNSLNNAGILNIAGASSASSINNTGSLNINGKLDVANFTGSETSQVSIAAGSALNIGASAVLGHVTNAGSLSWTGAASATSMNLADGSSLNFKIGDSLSMGDVTTGGTVNINMITMLRTIGTTTLGTYTSFDDLANLVLTGIDNSSARLKYSLDTTVNGQINLVVSGEAASLTWNQASTGGIWSANLTDSKWDTSVTDKWFQNTDIVNFLSGGEVTVQGTVAPGSMNVSGADVVFLCGTDNAGSIQTAMLNNSANMTLDGGQDHSLGFVNNAGSIALSGSALATASSWNGTGSLDMGAGSSLTLTGDASLAQVSNRGSLSLSGSSSVAKINGGGELNFSGVSLNIAQMTDGSLINSSGTVNIAAMTGTTVTNAGTININGNVLVKSINGTVNLNSGASLTGVLDGATLTLAGNSSLTLNQGSQDSNILGTGNILVKGDSSLSSLKGTSAVSVDKEASLSLTGDSSMGSLKSEGTVNNSATLNLMSGAANSLGNIVGTGTLILSGSSQSQAKSIQQGTLSLQDSAQLKLSGGTVDTLTATGWSGSLVLSINGATSNGTLLTVTNGADQLTTSNTSVSFDASPVSLLNKDITLVNGVNFGDGLIIGGKAQNADSSAWLTYTDASGSYIQYQYTGDKIIFANEANVVITKPDLKPTTGTTENVEAKVIGGDVKTGSNNSLVANVDGVASITDKEIGTGIQSATGISSKATSMQIVTKDYVNGELINTSATEIGEARLGLSLGEDTEITGDGSNASKIENVDYTTVTSGAKVNMTGVDLNAGTQLYASSGAEMKLDATGLKIGDTVMSDAIANNKDALKASSTSQINNATLDLKNSSLQVVENKTADGTLLDTTMSISNSKITLTNELGVGKDTILGSTNSTQTQLNLIESEIGGTGTIQNANVIGGLLRAGNSPGQLTLTNVNAYGTVFTGQICGGGAAILVDGINKDATTGTGNVGQFLLGSNLNVSGSSFKVENWVDSSGKSFDTTRLQAGCGFQFFDLAGHQITGDFASFDVGNVKLADGLMWDWSALTSTGIGKVMWSAIADGSRVANTLWTSGQTVANISTEAVKHVGEAVTGKTTVWLSSLNDFTRANSAGSTTGYDFNTQGYSVGAQRGLEGGHVIGLAFGNSYGTHTPLQDSTHASAGKIKQDAVMGTIYGRVMLSKATATDKIWSIDAYAGYGEVSNKSDRTVNYDSSNAHAKWDDMVKTLGVQANYAKKLNEKTILTPFAGLDFIHGEQDSFTEYAKSVKASYDNGAYYNLRASLGAGISHVVEFSNGMALIPSLSASYGYDICRMNPHTDVSEAAGNYRAYGVNPGRNSFQITPALSWKINKDWSASTNYTLRTRSGLTDQSVNASVSYTF